MASTLETQHLGLHSNALGDWVKARLVPLEMVCRYREQRGDDTSSFDIRPANKQALPFKVVIAPGGVNIETSLFTVIELPITERDLAHAFIEAILSGRVRQVVRRRADGKALAAKAYVFDAQGLPVYKHRNRAGLLSKLQKTASIQRVRFVAYSGS